MCVMWVLGVGGVPVTCSLCMGFDTVFECSTGVSWVDVDLMPMIIYEFDRYIGFVFNTPEIISWGWFF